jgi:hypothetical protein
LPGFWLILAWLSNQKDRIGAGLEKVHDQIRDYLREQKLDAQKNIFFNRYLLRRELQATKVTTG